MKTKEKLNRNVKFLTLSMKLMVAHLPWFHHTGIAYIFLKGKVEKTGEFACCAIGKGLRLPVGLAVYPFPFAQSDQRLANRT